MAGLNKVQAGFKATLWRYDEDSVKTEATIVAALGIPANEIINIEEMGTFTVDSTIIEAGFFGKTIIDKYIGMTDYGTFDITIGTDQGNTLHKAIRDDARIGSVHTYVLHLTDGTNSTYVAFDGFIGTTSMSTGKEDISMMETSIVLKSVPKFVDAA